MILSPRENPVSTGTRRRRHCNKRNMRSIALNGVGSRLDRQARAGDPLLGRLQLGGARQRLRAAPGARERLRAAVVDDGVAEAPARPRTGAASARARASARAPATAGCGPRRRRFIAARSRGSDGSTSAPTASIVCSAWPSISDIAACMRSTSCQRSSPSVSRRSSPRRARSTSSRSSPGSGSLGQRLWAAGPERRGLRSRRAAAVGRGRVVGVRLEGRPERHLQPVDQLSEHPAEVLAQPRRAGELDGVGDLVDRHPQHELVAVDAEVARRLRQVRREQQQPRRHAGVEQREVVLAEHALGEHARERPDLRAEQEARGRAQRPGQRAGGCPDLVDALGQRRQQRAHRLQVGRDPRRPVDGLERRQLRRRSPGRCRRSRGAAKSCASGSTDAARTPPYGGEPATSSPIRWAAPQSIASTHRA